ncbi:MAG TPA: metallopeptidase family protein [bacterium]|nr:metallopeptidase family protein [bacterium]
MDRSDFRKLVEEALREIPPEFLRALDNVAVVVEGRPSRAQARAVRLRRGDVLLGLYEGVPLTRRTGGCAAMPDRITIFQEQIEELYATPDGIKKAVRTTVVHELAHYFGIGERRIEELGYD